MPRDDFPSLKEGDELQAWHLNIIYAELRKLRKTKAAPPLAVKGFEQGGTTPFIMFIPDLNYAVAVATSNITPMSGTIPGYGTATIQDFDGTNLSNSVLTLDKVFNYHDKTYDVGAYIWVIMFANVWWVIDIDSCTHLS